MIELNKKTQQDFLNREWVQKLLDAGVDMSDAKYYICSLTYGKIGEGENIQVALKSELPFIKNSINNALSAHLFNWCLPTYTVSELLYKLHEWIYPTINGEEYSGGLKILKDAPFYFAYYDLKNREGKEKTTEFYAEAEYPIESLASLLIQCHQKGIGDTGNISDK